MTPGKRAMDLAIALVLLCLLSPVMVVIAALILVLDGRPVLYRATRMRSPTRAFTMWKFRSMRPGAPSVGVTGGHKAAQITRLGHLLRRTRADELPQLWNVIRGDMSLVGPRPPTPEHVALAPERFARVLRMRPGVTGLATVMLKDREACLLAACRTAAETESVYLRRCLPWKTRVEMIYARRRSLLWDLRLTSATITRGMSWRKSRVPARRVKTLGHEWAKPRLLRLVRGHF